MKNIDEIKRKIEELKPLLKKRFKVRRIGVFGSYTRGEQKEESDLDVLVEFYEPVSLLGLVRLENYLTDILGVKVDVVPKKDVRAELRKRISKETVYL